MNLMKPLALTILALGLCSLAALGAEPSKDAGKYKSAKTETTPPAKATSSDELTQALRSAGDKFLKQDLTGGAEVLRTAAGILETDVRSARDDVAADLTTASENLRALAADADRGIAVSREKLDEASTRAYWAEARDRYTKAAQAWTEEKSDQAGKELDQAADNLERSFADSGRKMDRMSQDAVKDARSVADRIAKGADWTRTELSERIARLGKEIDRFGQSLEPKKTDDPKPDQPEKGALMEKAEGAGVGNETGVLCFWRPGDSALITDASEPGPGAPVTWLSIACTTR